MKITITMKIMIKKAVISGIASGIVYALVMEWDSFGSEADVDFNLNMFLINFLWFGAFMGITNYYSLLKRSKRE